eukprot:scaffold42335_cov15-Tisochrysis_lutea.AAC.1
MSPCPAHTSPCPCSFRACRIFCCSSSEQLCKLSSCRVVPRVWGQKASTITAKMRPSGSWPPACLTSSIDWALTQKQSLGGPWGLGRGFRKFPNVGRDMTSES